MRTLLFNVSGNTLEKDPGCDFSNVNSGSTGYVRIKLQTEDHDWAKAKKILSFTRPDGRETSVMCDSAGCATIPANMSSCDHFKLCAVGVTNDFTIVTNNVLIE